ncbi:MAG TPA: hypothetical protein VFJ82_21240 [Longimicrobium sp.]|nr:hypothetical protein [Longimicrobium sp.]
MSPVPWYRLAGPRTPARPQSRRGPRGRRAAVRALAACLAAGLPAAAVAQACTPPPVVPPSLLQQGSDFGPFQKFVSDSLSFVGPDTKTVIPCPGRDSTCKAMRGTVTAERRANCLDSAAVMLPDARVVGTVQRDSGWNPANLGFGRLNTHGLVYLLAQGGKSVAVANWAGKVHVIPQAANSWFFRFHREAHTWPDSHALWRADSSATTGLVAMHARPAEWRGGPSAFVDDDGGGGFQMVDPAYVWMTCAAGCCQFHGSPPDGSPGPHGPPPPPPHHHGHPERRE